MVTSFRPFTNYSQVMSSLYSMHAIQVNFKQYDRKTQEQGMQKTSSSKIEKERKQMRGEGDANRKLRKRDD